MRRRIVPRSIVLTFLWIAVLFLVLQGFGESLKKSRVQQAADKAPVVFTGLVGEVLSLAEEGICELLLPILMYSDDIGRHPFLTADRLDCLIPLYGYVLGQNGERERRSLTLEDAEEGRYLVRNPEEEAAVESGDSGEEAAQIPSEAAAPSEPNPQNAQTVQPDPKTSQTATVSSFVPHERQKELDTASLLDYETLISQFYTVDANTMVGKELLDVEAFLKQDLTIEDTTEGPQILIFHTHSQEGFADSVEGEEATTIVGVGERLGQILEENYGFRVLHHTAAYDKDTRDGAYSRALPGIERLLEENPSIQVVIDLHRDAMPKGKKLLCEVDGRPTAKFMFFNGLSRTKKTGDITYLYNRNLKDNLALSFRMKLTAEEYYPGLTRKNYLKGYRYNMHLKDKYLLIELGAQTNTVEEAMNACDPLAHILSLVLQEE